MTERDKKQVVIWLLCGCFLIFTMVVIGGITRLTGSGLSITEWDLIMGTLPPLNAQQWEEAFGKYREIPQYQKVNYDYDLSDFKKIYFWEYFHRMMGRLIGIVFIIPFLYFLSKKKLNREWIRKSLFLFVLGGVQGFLGWFMVKSGLSERTSVSHYRLAIHLVTAFITFGFTFWYAMQLIFKQRQGEFNPGYFSLLKMILGVIVLQLVYGAFVAGLHAGRLANTFPKMDGEWIPSGINSLSPGYLNLFENVLTVQFIHRCLAYLIVILIGILWFKARKEKLPVLQMRSVNLCALAVVIQFLLGIFTLLYHVPIVLAILHQAGGFFLFSCVIAAVFFGSKIKLVAN